VSWRETRNRRFIIGLCGYGQVGKDEVGRILCENHEFRRFAKGDLIKYAAWQMSPALWIEEPVKDRPTPSWIQLHDLLGGCPPVDGRDPVEWIDSIKDKYPAVRRYLQNLADNLVDVLGFDAWNQALYREILMSGTQRVVLTRLSLPIEVEELRSHGGLLVRVSRPGYGPANDHPNEVALDTVEPDYTLDNSGSFDLLTKNVAEMVHELF